MDLRDHKRRIVQDIQETRRTLIASHRGVSSGNIIQNTLKAFLAAKALGADVLELDISRTIDGRLYVYHDGAELTAFGVPQNIETMSGAEVEQLTYYNCIGSRTNQKVETLHNVLAGLKGLGLINLDRGWNHWSDVIPIINRVGIADQVILKSPVHEEFLTELTEQGTDLMYIPIVRNVEDIEKALSFDLNHLGMEIVFRSKDDDLVSPVVLRGLRDKGLLLWANAINLNERDLLADCLDDETSLLGDPDEGWGRLRSMGFNIIQTDWPAQLKEYLARK